ncbi:MAG: TrmH family RNA methyltransferase [Victivallaceae bacterium]
MEQLTKNQEALIKALYTRHGRKKHELCVCEGVRCCTDFLAARPDLLEFLVCTEDFSRDFDHYNPVRIPESQFARLSATIASQGILAVARKPEPVSESKPPEDPFVFVLDRVGDPGNFGTILRTVKAAGLKELWYTSGSVDPFNDKVLRSAMAAQFTVGLREFASLETLKQALAGFGYNRFYRTDPHQGENCFTEPHLFDKSAIIIGSEADGAGELEGSAPVTIPMPGNSESLNAAQAATIFLFEYVRRTMA